MRKYTRTVAKANMRKEGFWKMFRPRGLRGKGRSAFALNWRRYC